tara:strand:+ start:698 stop:919 length:222 start_codon:yes stop_codon:yes gene_type:complete
MLEALTMGFNEQNIAYDLQRAHSADIWFLRARFLIWGTVSTIVSFLVGQTLALFNVNLVMSSWEGFWQLIYSF